MKKILLLAAALWLALVPAAFAQGHGHNHSENGPHGGAMEDVAGVHAELVITDRKVTVYIFDEASKPVPATGYTGSALVGAGQARQVIQLTSGSDNALSGTAPAPVAKGTPITLQLKTPGGKTGQAKF